MTATMKDGMAMDRSRYCDRKLDTRARSLGLQKNGTQKRKVEKRGLSQMASRKFGVDGVGTPGVGSRLLLSFGDASSCSLPSSDF